MAMHDGRPCAYVGVWQAMAVFAFLSCDYMPAHLACHGTMCADIRPLHACLVMRVGLRPHTWFMDPCTSHRECISSGEYNRQELLHVCIWIHRGGFTQIDWVLGHSAIYSQILGR